MNQVYVICDSAADLPQELREELGIGLVSIPCHIEGTTYYDGVDIFADQFYAELAESKEIPFTSQPSPMDYVNAYQKAIDEGAKKILLVSLSSGLSGSYQTAVLASTMLENPDVEIEVFDSRSASLGSGLQVIAAARAAKAGKSLEEIKGLLESNREHTSIFFLVDTLEYLQKGGRIGKASAVVGSLLNIKPILSVNQEGVVYAVDKVRGKNKAFERLFGLIKEQVQAGAVSVGVMHARNPEEADKWVRRVEQEFEVKELIVTEIGPVIGTHAGPGTVAISVVPYLEV
ncbi:DegV family protein [Thermoactinomyces sp. DSM 45892]|uniref:DegV family protein n=1 Tax=Thermoactinomyces sp. DSM 45892 TaxID=1882753 RepID=UPI000898ABA9|nr:DegV family protein [Thermoactinomyces sp. DSM 45892]SDY57120.1 EDD domain protein, DegV family [Thermoactinomyces sp. DSM 45892]